MDQNFDGLPQLAGLENLQDILNLIDDAAAWLQNRGLDQWAKPWPSREERDERVRKSLLDGDTWLLWDGPTLVATVTTHRHANPKLWNEMEQAEPAVYVHRLIVSRNYAGLDIGAGLLDWTAARAAREYGALWIRGEVWNTNEALHKYYKQRGFSYVRQADYEDCPATALFQRPIRDHPEPLGSADG
jgi:GNAT superfamily N-acetyltransferase